jgi:hypothetical protein
MSNITRNFFNKIKVNEETSCWEWTGHIDKAGYGGLTIYDKRYRAHSIMWFMTTGYRPKKNEFICHHCDNRKCVNPGHLYLGSHITNVTDCMNRDRYKKKLSKKDIKEIISLYKRKIYSQTELAVKYGVTQAAISYMLRRNDHG